MPIRKHTIDPPFTHQSGDQYFAEGKTVEHVRTGIVIDSRTYDQYFSLHRVELTELVGGPSIDRFYWEYHMPGINVSITNVRELASGAVLIDYSNGTQNEYTDWASVGAVADEIDASPIFAEKLLAAKSFRASPDGSNKTTQIGASVSVNGLADVPVVYTEPQ